MSQRRWSLAALALAPILALGACDQLSDVWNRMTGQAHVEGPGPAPLDDVPLAARALSGAVQPQAEMAAILAPDPVLIAPGRAASFGSGKRYGPRYEPDAHASQRRH